MALRLQDDARPGGFRTSIVADHIALLFTITNTALPLRAFSIYIAIESACKARPVVSCDHHNSHRDIKPGTYGLAKQYPARLLQALIVVFIVHSGNGVNNNQHKLGTERAAAQRCELRSPASHADDNETTYEPHKTD